MKKTNKKVIWNYTLIFLFFQLFAIYCVVVRILFCIMMSYILQSTEQSEKCKRMDVKTRSKQKRSWKVVTLFLENIPLEYKFINLYISDFFVLKRLQSFHVTKYYFNLVIIYFVSLFYLYYLMGDRKWNRYHLQNLRLY